MSTVGSFPQPGIDPEMPTKHFLKFCLTQYEKFILEKYLDYNRWNRKATARELGISYRSILLKIDRYGLTRKVAA